MNLSPTKGKTSLTKFDRLASGPATDWNRRRGQIQNVSENPHPRPKLIVDAHSLKFKRGEVL
jgi:hypothetical protein